MSSFWLRLIQLILALTILVVFHEFGHFTFSRLFKVRVEKFYAFFNPQFSIFRIKRVNGRLRCRFFAPNVPESYIQEKTVGEDGEEQITYKPVDIGSLPEDDWRRSPENTEFGMGWVPFGGYCKIAGMIDESMDVASMQQAPKPWEFRTKPAWQRFMIMVGGVLFNLILAFFIYSMILFKWGDSYIPVESPRYGYEFNDFAKSIGFCDGDVILSVDGKQAVSYDADLYRDMAKAKTVVVLRDGREVPIDMPDGISLFDFTGAYPFISIYSPSRVDSVYAGALQGGMRPGDTVVTLNGMRADTWTSFMYALSTVRESGASHELGFVVKRENGSLDTLSVLSDEDYLIGVVHKSSEYSYKELEYSFWKSIPAGIQYGWNTLANYVGDFRYVFTKEGAKSLGGFGTIGKLFPSKWNWHAFWLMTAFLSVILAFMNILPIPALDGGYVLFLLVEIITGRKPGDKFLERANTVGTIILLALLVVANMNDILRVFNLM